jgi:succinoglycan biosynthesis transport protein ExoP
MDRDGSDLKSYINVLRARKRQVLGAMGVLALLAGAVAILVPPAYRATATIVVEEQGVPADLVPSTVTTYASQRIQLISRQVMTDAKLAQVVQKFHVYPALQQEGALDEAVEKLRAKITLEILDTDVTDPKSGRSGKATIAFTLTYKGETPEVTQAVTNELANLFLTENVKMRTQSAVAASSFLAEEANRLHRQMSELETRIAAFKQKNVNQLPELADLNMQMMNRTDSELLSVDNQIQALESTKIDLGGQLAQTHPDTPIMSVTGQRILDSSERLRALEAQYAGDAGVYSPSHPDMVKMRREIASLRGGGGGADAGEQMKQLTASRAALAEMRKRYSAEHPDVQRLTRSIAALERSVKHPARVARSSAVKPENPAYIALQSRLAETANELKALRAKRTELSAKIADYEQRLIHTPQVEREYRPMMREYDNAVKRYDEIKAKQMEAQVAAQLETEQKGERFSLLEAAELPTHPAKPGRLMILWVGLALSVLGGIGYASLAEALDRSIRGEGTLAGIAGEPPLATIPYIENGADTARRRKARAVGVTVGATAGVVLVVWALQSLWIP